MSTDDTELAWPVQFPVKQPTDLAGDVLDLKCGTADCRFLVHCYRCFVDPNAEEKRLQEESSSEEEEEEGEDLPKVAHITLGAQPPGGVVGGVSKPPSGRGIAPSPKSVKGVGRGSGDLRLVPKKSNVAEVVVEMEGGLLERGKEEGGREAETTAELGSLKEAEGEGSGGEKEETLKLV